MGIYERIKSMHDRNRMKLPTAEEQCGISSDKEMEQFILNSKVEDLFGFMHWKMANESKPVQVGIAWENILYTIKCQPVENGKQAEAEFKRNIK